NMGAYLRKMALDGYILRLDLPELKEMLSQLRYMGNNVNQIAKRANEVGVIDEMDIRGVSKRQERMLEQIARLLEKLSGLN
ncbi:MAG: plasmid mobilization relaxosome protein MobC, partial [Christensenellales bacterium]